MKKISVIHPLLFAMYFTLTLFARNIALVPAHQIVRPLVIIPLFALLLFFLINIILKDDKKSGLLAALFILWFFSYSHFYRIFDILTGNAEFVARGFKDRKSGVFFVFSGIILLVGVYRIIRARESLVNLTKILFVASVSLFISPLIQIGLFSMQSGAFHYRLTDPGNIKFKGSASGSYPNIYYIILDAYGREDVLEEVYGYDNKDFITYLIGKGFYVAGKSRANYCQTVLSFASSLNLQYLDDLVLEISAENPDRKYATAMLQNSFVFKFLKKHGYTTVTFDAGGGWEDVVIKNADKFYDNFKDPLLSHFDELNLNLFEKTMLNNTPVSSILSKLRKKRKEYGCLGDAYDSHRRKILYSFDKIEDLSKEQGPMFVFCHFLLPHQPFVFEESGKPIKTDVPEFTIWCWDNVFRKNFKNNYKKQIAFTDKRVRKMLDSIIANSPQPPIIILQADHGPELMLDRENPDKTNLKERMSILNAYYLPGYGNEGLYPSVTPVNTFRLILNRYFGADFELLEDKSFFSTWSKPYKFIKVR